MRIRKWNCCVCGKILRTPWRFDMCQECLDETIKNKDQFLDEYEKLCRKYRLHINTSQEWECPVVAVLYGDRHLKKEMKLLQEEEVEKYVCPF